MNCFNTLALAMAGLSLIAAPLAAKEAKDFSIPKGTLVLLCDLKVPEVNGTTPSKILVMTDKAGKITAYDGLIAAEGLGPLPVTVMTDNDRRTTYGWTVPGSNDDLNQYANATKMRLTVQKADLSALLVVNPVG